jgi:hypothetical protein
MPNFGLCEVGRSGLDALTSNNIDLLASRLAAGAESQPPDDAKLTKVAQDFAAIFYSIAFKEMQQSTSIPGEEGGGVDGESEEDNPVAQGAQDFMAMFLPRAVAGDGSDPLARYIYDSLKQHYVEALDEKT